MLCGNALGGCGCIFVARVVDEHHRGVVAGNVLYRRLQAFIRYGVTLAAQHGLQGMVAQVRVVRKRIGKLAHVSAVCRVGYAVFLGILLCREYVVHGRIVGIFVVGVLGRIGRPPFQSLQRRHFCVDIGQHAIDNVFGIVVLDGCNGVVNVAESRLGKAAVFVAHGRYRVAGVGGHHRTRPLIVLQSAVLAGAHQRNVFANRQPIVGLKLAIGTQRNAVEGCFLHQSVLRKAVQAEVIVGLVRSALYG